MKIYNNEQGKAMMISPDTKKSGEEGVKLFKAKQTIIEKKKRCRLNKKIHARVLQTVCLALFSCSYDTRKK